ncbi:hypothetical protein H632_c1280p1 [Helicosporidium sp. ATCC 50920]|nr:hypothetical protein H632_c1280p1 [Helicosporidium sp. ATCC 50920]|eukprot:KDD74486.1 hypothetical protein H632_c1280p1 [Helicosporidium sp. ATCC 50920]
MRHWTGTIIGPPNTVHDGRIYTLKIYCDENYPNKPPQVRFETRVAMNGVSDTGVVDLQRFPLLASWNREDTMEKVLVVLRREMASPANRKLPQPQEGTIY